MEGLGDDVDVGDDGHEVGVSDPAGDDVPVEVAGESGTGDVADTSRGELMEIIVILLLSYEVVAAILKH